LLDLKNKHGRDFDDRDVLRHTLPNAFLAMFWKIGSTSLKTV